MCSTSSASLALSGACVAHFCINGCVGNNTKAFGSTVYGCWASNVQNFAYVHRFARARCCPLCRTEAYQKRQVHDGREAHRHRCAARMQAAVRGYLARKWYRQLRRRLPPQDACLTRKWAAEQLQVGIRLYMPLVSCLTMGKAALRLTGG